MRSGDIEPPVRPSDKIRPHRIMVAASLVVPLLLFAVIAWQDHRVVMQDAEREVLRTTEIFRQHALNVFETHQLVADRVNDRIRGMDWDRIGRSEAIREYLGRISDNYPQVQAIWLADSSGAVRNGSLPLSASPADVSDRDFFRELRSADVGLSIGSPVGTQSVKGLNFNLARRREGKAGTFDGVIFITVHPGYFSDFWNKSFGAADMSTALVRSDGRILARAPALNPDRLSLLPESETARAIRRDEKGAFFGVSTSDRSKRLYSIRRIGNHNVYLVHGMGRKIILQEWGRDLLFYGGVFGVATTALLLLALDALRRTREEARAVRHWQETAMQLDESGARLAAAMQRLQLAVDSGSLGIWDWDIAANAMAWDDRMLELYGLPRAAFPGNVEGWQDRLHPDDRENALAAFRAALEGKAGYDTDYRIVLTDGTVRYLKADGTVVRNADGDPVRMIGINRDITERKRIQEELTTYRRHLEELVEQRANALLVANERLQREIRERIESDAVLHRREEELATILQTAMDGFWVTDRAGRFLEVNDAVCRMLGYSREELLRMSISDVEAADKPEAAAESTGRIMESRHGRFEGMHRRKDGLLRDVEISVNYLPPPHDRFFVFLRDITERKRAERERLELQRSAVQRLALLDTLLMHAPIGIAFVDPLFRYVRINRELADINGVSIVEHIGRTVSEVVPGLWPQLEPIYRRALAGELVLSVEISGTTKARPSETRSWLGNYYPVRSEHGVVGVGVIIVDITDRKRIEGALRNSEADLLEAQRVAHVGSWKWERKADTVTWSDELWRITGRDPKSNPPNPVSGLASFYTPESWARLQPLVERAIRTGEPYRVDVEMVRPDGTTRWTVTTVEAVRNADGAVVGLRGTVHDITDRVLMERERRDLEEQMRHVQKLESLGVLAGGVAHDFNNLLMAILGYTDLALARLPPGSPVREYLQEVEKASRRAADLCQQMLAYSGKGRFLLEYLDVGEVVREIAGMLELSISKKAVLEYRLVPDLPKIEADASQVRQIVMNLIMNASEAVGDRPGTISLSTGATDCDRAFLDGIGSGENLPAGRYVFIEVGDTGCGMDEETRGKIFDPFFTTKFAGRGLGLAAVLGIVRGHRGAITVASEVGKGSVFKVLFPAAGDAVKPAAVEESPGGEWKGSGTLLLVDDEEMIRAVGVSMLESLGFRVLTAAEGREALEVFQAHMDEVACVLLDLTMPRLGGEETFREMRRIHPGVRVILTSGYDEQQVVQRFVAEGLAGFLQKPYSTENLAAKLRQVLER